MEKDTNEIEKEIEKLEALMQEADFWSDKGEAQATLRELAELKAFNDPQGIYARMPMDLAIQ